MALRFINGLTNGTLGVVKTYLGELTDSTNRVKTFSYFGIANGIGSIIGSFIGGISAQPAKSFPSVFSNEGIFGAYPYLLPNLICGFSILVNVFLAIVYLQENFPKQYVFFL